MRRSRSPATGLALLDAAVREARHEEQERACRSGLVARDLLDAGPLPPGRLGNRDGRRTPGTGRAVAIPSPSPSGDSAHPDPEASDEDARVLVRRAQDGDAEAFGLLYDRHVDLVHRYIRYRVGGRELAEDLTSETFLRALRKLATYEAQGPDLGAWLVTIARNLVADHYKSARYRLELTTDDVATSAGALVEEGPENAVLTHLQNGVLLDAVRRLRADQQECIVLRFLQGLSVRETAQIMGRNDDAIKSLQHRAVRALGRLLPEGLEL